MTYADTYFSSSTLAPANITLNKTSTANGTISVSGSGPTRTVTISGITGDGSLGISVAAGTATDLAGNQAPAAGASTTFIVDNTLPTISISAPLQAVSPPVLLSPSAAASGPVYFTVTYANANFNICTLAPWNISLNSTGTAAASVVSVSGTSSTTRTVTINGITGDGTLAISIVSGTASDMAGNLAPAAGPSATFIVDNTVPSVTIGAPSVPSTASGPVTYTVTYSDANFSSSGLAKGNVTLNTTGTATGTVSVAAGFGAVRTVTITSIKGDGTLGISIAAGTASDMAGNTAPAAGPSATFNVVNSHLGVFIGAPSAPYTAGGPITYTVSYVNATNIGLALANITLNKTGTANGTLSVSGTGLTTRTVTISGITGDGTLGISIAAGTATDLAGDDQAPPAGPSATFTVDNTAPTISIGAPSASYAAGGPVTYTVTYGDANFNSSTLAAANITLNATGTATGTVSCLRFGPDPHGHHQQHYGRWYPGDFDRGGHGHGPGGQPGPGRRAQRDLHGGQHGPDDLDRRPLGGLYDRRAHHLHSDIRRHELQFQHPGYGEHYPEHDRNRQRHDQRVSGSGLSYTVTVSSIAGDGTLGISIAAGTATDLAGNQAPAASSTAFTVDNTAPTILIGSPSASYTAGGPITYTVTYADPNFNASTLAAANITLNTTGTANGTISVSPVRA